MTCPICEKRPTKRFCPAKGERICPICCGKEREVTIDCPSDCPHLVAAYRYEAEHRKPMAPEDYPHPEIEFPADFVYERWPVVTALGSTILGFQIQNPDVDDSTVHSSMEALAETYRTLDTGIYYERPPDALLARSLYRHLAESVSNLRKQETERTGITSPKESDIFRLLVFLLRVCKNETNGRPRSRAFLRFLRDRFPLPVGTPKEEPRIIIP